MTAIRPLADSDHAEWRRLWTDYLAFYEAEVSEEVYATTWERLMGDALYDARGLIAEHEGRAIGLTHFFLQRHGWRIEHVTFLQDLYVDPDTRGTGAGRALIEAVYGEADRLGAPVVYWNTAETNATARRLYDRIGVKTPFIKYQR